MPYLSAIPVDFDTNALLMEWGWLLFVVLV